MIRVHTGSDSTNLKKHQTIPVAIKEQQSISITNLQRLSWKMPTRRGFFRLFQWVDHEDHDDIEGMMVEWVVEMSNNV